MLSFKGILYLSLASIGGKVCHKLSSRKFTNHVKTDCLEQPQIASRLMPNTPVITILYIISDNCGPALFALCKRIKLRLLSLGWNSEGHNPSPFQVLHLKNMWGAHA